MGKVWQLWVLLKREGGQHVQGDMPRNDHLEFRTDRKDDWSLFFKSCLHRRPKADETSTHQTTIQMITTTEEVDHGQKLLICQLARAQSLRGFLKPTPTMIAIRIVPRIFYFRLIIATESRTGCHQFQANIGLNST
jgi:hypothetical protein